MRSSLLRTGSTPTAAAVFPDTGGNVELAAIPVRVKRAATMLSVAFYTAEMSPDAMNPFDADFQTQRASNMAMQLLTGFRVSWGVA